MTQGGHYIVKLRTMCKQKKYTFSKLHHQNGSNVYQIFSWVDIHGIDYMVKFDNQMWWSLFLENIPFLTRMLQNWTNTITRKNEDDHKFQKNIEKILSMVLYM